ncbi:MAG: hypothetical protein ACI4RT_01810 [Candidatus Spyradenecus sp.]
MHDEDIATFDKQMSNAKTDEERTNLLWQWFPHFARCLNSTNAHIKAVERAQNDGLAEIRKGLDTIRATIEELHRVPRWSTDKLGWLKANWMWVVIMLYIAQSMLGVNVAVLIERFAK